MFVVVPELLQKSRGNIRRGVTETTVVESIDLMPTLADLASIPLPRQVLGGETLTSLLFEENKTQESGHAWTNVQTRQKTYALSQWPRRPSCATSHTCVDGHDDPFRPEPDVALMGYTLRTDDWRYTAWMAFDWNKTEPIWTNVSVRFAAWVLFVLASCAAVNCLGHSLEAARRLVAGS